MHTFRGLFQSVAARLSAIALTAVFFTMVFTMVGVLLPSPAIAASSAAIRAIDDVQPTGKDYSGQNLIRAEFANVRLKEANFSRADLRGAVFNGSDLTNANLSDVDFTDGIAYITNFTGANLTNAVLNAAMMLKSVFKDVTATGADFTDAVIGKDQIVEICKTASGTNPVTGADTRESLGCS